MIGRLSQWLMLCIILLLSHYQSTTAAIAETQIGSSVESRVTLAFKVDDAAAQAWLPDGWTLASIPRGPLAGANVIVSLIDWHLARDAEGKPEDPHARRAVATVAYGVKGGVEGMRTFITRIYETPPVISPYSNSVSAQIMRSSSLTGSADGARINREVWAAQPEAGGEIRLELSHQAGIPSWSASETMPYSSAQPDFHRIYRYQQLVDLVMSKALGKELEGRVEFKSTVSELADMFDGTESLVGIITTPVYVTETFLP